MPGQNATPRAYPPSPMSAEQEQWLTSESRAPIFRSLSADCFDRTSPYKRESSAESVRARCTPIREKIGSIPIYPGSLPRTSIQDSPVTNTRGTCARALFPIGDMGWPRKVKRNDEKG